MRPISILTIVGCIFLVCWCTSGDAQSISQAQWQAQQIAASQKSETIMREANKHKSLLAQYEAMLYPYVTTPDPAFHVIFGQYLSWYQTFVGDYPDAAVSFSIKQAALPDDRPSPMGNPDYTARPALEVIPELARNHRIVLFNEAHNVALTRTLTVQLLSKLRAEGFDYFAAETLYQTDTGLQARGYPVAASGFYTKEPICAEMVRTALKLGFKVIAYETMTDAGGNLRETEQARNLYDKVFKHDPHARLVVDAGYAHIQESGVYLGGKSMAQHLRKLTGLDPLTVEQTMLYPHPAADGDHPYYGPIMEALKPAEPIVFVNKAGEPWSLRPGYDVSVFFPPQKMRRGRPTWLSLGGLRRPYYVTADRCNHTLPCLVEARYADERADAIPADRLILSQLPLNATVSDRVSDGLRVPVSELYLRPGKYRLTYSDAGARELYGKDITVSDGADRSNRRKVDPRSGMVHCAPAGALPSNLQSKTEACTP